MLVALLTRGPRPARCGGSRVEREKRGLGAVFKAERQRVMSTAPASTPAASVPWCRLNSPSVPDVGDTVLP